MIPENASVLDIGCGEGVLLESLKTKNIQARGIETRPGKKSRTCLKKRFVSYAR